MIVPLTRRHLITATLSASILPRLAWAQSTSIIDGRTLQGTRATTGKAGQGVEGMREKSAITQRISRFMHRDKGCVKVNGPTTNIAIEVREAGYIHRLLEATTPSNP